MNRFLSCDWGTTSFRLRLVDVSSFLVNSVESSDLGVVKVFEAWKKSGAGKKKRFEFYFRIISEQIKILEHKTGQSLKNLPLIISGMAASSLGMLELGYKKLPVPSDGRDLEIKKINGVGNFSDIMIISGVRSGEDAMRGEETQLAGCKLDKPGKRIFIFPGTHSKHVTVRNGMITDIKTYMTGEFFALLSEKSILSASVQNRNSYKDKLNKKYFREGVLAGSHFNLLHAAFLVRTNHLFKNLAPEANYYYLSGLLIGNELGELNRNKKYAVTLVASGKIKELYLAAFKIPGFKNENKFRIEDADQVMVKGQWRIWRHIKK